jgi:hypothetical protein
LVAPHGGRDRMLRVADLAKKLGVCAATVYRLRECAFWVPDPFAATSAAMV